MDNATKTKLLFTYKTARLAYQKDYVLATDPRKKLIALGKVEILAELERGLV